MLGRVYASRTTTGTGDAMTGATTDKPTEATAAQSDRSEQVRTPVAQQASTNTADTDPGAETREDADPSALGGQAPDAVLDSLSLSLLTETPDLERPRMRCA